MGELVNLTELWDNRRIQQLKVNFWFTILHIWNTPDWIRKLQSDWIEIQLFDWIIQSVKSSSVLEITISFPVLQFLEIINSFPVGSKIGK